VAAFAEQPPDGQGRGYRCHVWPGGALSSGSRASLLRARARPLCPSGSGVTDLWIPLIPACAMHDRFLQETASERQWLMGLNVSIVYSVCHN
jgi:hypothetical protein